jgi:outer membrane lipoprotein-sorting protein
MNSFQGFVDNLKEAGEKTNTISCEFDQVKHLSVLSNSINSYGKFYFKKKQNICLEYSNPEGNLIVMNGEKLKLVSNGKTTIFGMRGNPFVGMLGNMLTACMTGNIALFGKESDIEYYESKSCYTVIINPTSNRVKGHLQMILLQFDKTDMTLSKMKMVENENDYTVYEFKNKKLNIEVDSTKFEI